MLLLSFILLWKLLSDMIKGKLNTYLTTVVLWTFILLCITEVLSMRNGLTSTNLYIVWLLICLFIVFLIIFNYIKNRGRKLHKRITNILKLNFVLIFNAIRKNLDIALFSLYSINLIMLAIFTVPYNWDSMTYHLTRIMHWIQNNSVAHYAALDLRQITSPPLAEFINLQVMLLHGNSDNLVNLLQCGAYLTNAIVVRGICQKLGLRRSFSNLACLLFLSMPTAFGEALSTQVDELASMWLLLFVYFFLDFVDKERKLVWEKRDIFRIAIMAVCIGLGYLTKPSIMFAIAVLLIWLFVVSIKRHDSIRIITAMCIVAFLTFGLVVSIEAIRNISTFHALSSPIAGERQLIGTLDPRYIVVDGLKNLTYNMPNIYINNSSLLLMKIVLKVASILKVDINAISIAEDGREFYLHPPQSYGHDTAVNPVIVISYVIILLCIIIKLIKKKKVLNLFNTYVLCVGIAFFSFCMVLRWEPFVSRYMLSYLALLCPAVAGYFQYRTGNNEKMKLCFLGILIFTCVVELIGLFGFHTNICKNQNISNREIGYYFNRGDITEGYQSLINDLRQESNCTIGLLLGGDSYEYPLWVGLRNHISRMESVCVMNESSVYVDNDFSPEYIVTDTMDCDEMEYNGETYKYVKKYCDTIVLLSKNSIHCPEN